MQAKTPLRNSTFLTDTEVESHSTDSEMIRFYEFERASTMKIKTTQGLHDAERGHPAVSAFCYTLLCPEIFSRSRH
ncbi:hypothetical protein CY34DRAFT_804054 [Suillus luteus UH-Slu-Lm8-n1]|uniref:Unplaced genomic scaffold CY34scaffold_86, whole genome shotgun sequence n=1 Tax=Suillus luteus UH-Slu-Lm8-n1 TaxID=930992 RepID=A0A0D0BAC7_9AGAM|nr:hypothetical protein CY34DRAFT_804054 [Suillus luteus UH-Slu-Lm8-n1]